MGSRYRYESRWEGSELNRNLINFSARVAAAALAKLTTYGIEIRADAQKNRPWTDRTGMAKATLNTTVSQPDSKHLRLTLSHGVWYGKYLEYAHGKRFAIIMPTLKKWESKVMRGMSGLFNSIGRRM